MTQPNSLKPEKPEFSVTAMVDGVEMIDRASYVYALYERDQALDAIAARPAATDGSALALAAWAYIKEPTTRTRQALVDALTTQKAVGAKAPADEAVPLCECGHGVNAHGTYHQGHVCYTCTCRKYKPKAAPQADSALIRAFAWRFEKGRLRHIGNLSDEECNALAALRANLPADGGK